MNSYKIIDLYTWTFYDTYREVNGSFYFFLFYKTSAYIPQ